MLFPSLFLLFLNSLALPVDSIQSVLPESEIMQEESSAERYSLQMEIGKGYLSGFLIVNRENDRFAGMIVNEFGLSALSFTYDAEKGVVKVYDVVSFLNKWQIKYVLKQDIRLIIDTLYNLPHKENKSYSVVNSPDYIRIENLKRNIIYTITE